MGYEYHDGMDVPRQGQTLDGGRVNQKRRTRAALVQAAQELVRQGTTPTVAEVAEVALVSRTTAYRYFPTQESLLAELAVTASVEEIDALVAEPAAGRDPAERVVEVLQAFNQYVMANEIQQRTMLRLYQDQWLGTVAQGGEPPVVREGRRVRWYGEVLAPLAGDLSPAQLGRLVAALALLSGAEGVTVLHDVCQRHGADALAVTEWAARTLVRATLAEARGEGT